MAPPPPAPVFSLAKAEKLSLGKRLAVMRACSYDKDAVCPSVKPGGSTHCRVPGLAPERAVALLPQALAKALE